MAMSVTNSLYFERKNPHPRCEHTLFGESEKVKGLESTSACLHEADYEPLGTEVLALKSALKVQ